MAPARLSAILASVPLGNAEALRRSEIPEPGERRRLEAMVAKDDHMAAVQDALSDGCRLLSGDERPAAVQRADHAPPALWVRGVPEVLDRPCIGIVGTRQASVYGKACAIKFAEAFARAGVTVVSGGAVGIDAAAHEGALQAGGATAAVLATDVVTQYPAANAGLFLRIRQSGTLVSQFAIGSSAADHKFIIRNGLLATLSDALVVIECPPKSGSLHTAGFAADFGKQVFVVPGRIDQTNFFGGFDLVRDGATLAYNPDQVLEALQIESRGPASVAAVAQGTAGRILDCLGVDPISPERLGELTGLPPAELATELTMLELEGAVRKEAGGYVKPL